MAKLGGGEAKVLKWLNFGHGFALGENGYAVSGAGRSEGVAWTQALAEVPVVVVRRLTRFPASTLLRRFLPMESSDRALDRTVSDVCR